VAASFRASTTNGATTGTTATGNKPSGTLDNDFLIAVVTSSAATITVTTVPTGWTLVQDDPNPVDFSIWTYIKIAASEPASWDWILSVDGAWRVDVLAYSGAATTGQPHKSAAEVLAAANSLAVGPIVPTVNDCVIVTIGAVDATGGARTWTSDGTTNERIDSALNGLQLGIYDEVQATAGTITRTVTVTGTVQDMAGHIIAIAPPSAAAGYAWPAMTVRNNRRIIL